jgi:hypothetical protein
MANLTDRLRGLIPSAIELRQSTNWEEWVIEDYLSILRNILEIAETVDTNEANANVDDVLQLAALYSNLNDRVGSGDPLTWDDTGFSWDTDKLSFDQTEA